MEVMLSFRLLVCAMGALLLISCQEAPNPSSMPSGPADAEVTIVRRGQARVTLHDVEAYLQRMPDQHRGAFLSDPKRVSDALASILRPRQLAAHARSDSAAFLENPTFLASLEQDSVEKIADRYLEWRWQQEVLEDYSSKAQELFLVRPDLFRKPLHVDFTQVLIRAGSGYSELAAVEGISKVFDALRNGKALAEVAANPPAGVSLDDSSRRFEEVDLTSLESTVAEVLQAIQPGDISEPFRSEYGWHIVELHRRFRPETGKFEENREQALELARQRHRTDFTERTLRQINNEPVEFVEGGLDILRQRYPASVDPITELRGKAEETSKEAADRD